MHDFHFLFPNSNTCTKCNMPVLIYIPFSLLCSSLSHCFVFRLAHITLYHFIFSFCAALCCIFEFCVFLPSFLHPFFSMFIYVLLLFLSQQFVQFARTSSLLFISFFSSLFLKYSKAKPNKTKPHTIWSILILLLSVKESVSCAQV